MRRPGGLEATTAGAVMGCWVDRYTDVNLVLAELRNGNPAVAELGPLVRLHRFGRKRALSRCVVSPRPPR